MCLEDRPVLEPNAAGIDVGAREMFVAVPPGRDEKPVRVFATFTEDLERLTDWLEQCGVTTVALESTGVYWIPLFEILEQRGIRPCLVNARHMKNVPGRRTDWHECQWLQFLHSVGLLRAAFRPGQDVCAVRTILRHRNELVAAASQHVQHMHKALTQMNLQIHHVISDITGSTGRAIVDAILAGQRDGAELAKLRDPHIKAGYFRSGSTLSLPRAGNHACSHCHRRSWTPFGSTSLAAILMKRCSSLQKGSVSIPTISASASLSRSSSPRTEGRVSCSTPRKRDDAGRNKRTT